MRSAIRQYKSIRVEVVVVRLVAEVAAVSPEVLSITAFFANALVYPIPDETAMSPRPRFEEVPVLLEVAGAVAHGVGIFDLEEWTALTIPIVVVRNVLGFGIHRSQRIPMNTVAGLIDDVELRMMRLCPLFCGHKIGTV